MEYFEIRVKEQLDSSWSEWFDDLAITFHEPDHTLLAGFLRDQAALFGILLKIRDMGLTLRSVTAAPPTLVSNPHFIEPKSFK